MIDIDEEKDQRVAEYVKYIRQAIYGEEVRGSISDAILVVNRAYEDSSDSAKQQASAAAGSAGAAAQSLLDIQDLSRYVDQQKRAVDTACSDITDYIDNQQDLIDDKYTEISDYVTAQKTAIDQAVQDASDSAGAASGSEEQAQYWAAQAKKIAEGDIKDEFLKLYYGLENAVITINGNAIHSNGENAASDTVISKTDTGSRIATTIVPVEGDYDYEKTVLVVKNGSSTTITTNYEATAKVNNV